MIRIIYKWRLKGDNELDFKSAWARATIAIRESRSGARGSFLLRSLKDPAEFITIARWDRLEDWKLFWENPNNAEMNEMHIYAERLSEEVYYEIADHTIESP
jgi:heme-degrading monooxygenase HmoA